MEWQIVFSWFARGAKDPRQLRTLWVCAESKREALAKAKAIIVKNHPAPAVTDELELMVFSTIGPRNQIAALAEAVGRTEDIQ